MKNIFLFVAILSIIFCGSCSNYLTVMAKDALECRVKQYDAFVALKSGDTIAGQKVDINYKKSKINMDGVDYDFNNVSTYQTKKALLHVSGKQHMRYLRVGQISMFTFFTSQFREVGQYPNNKTDVSSSNEIRIKKGDKFYFPSQGDLSRLIADKPKAVAEFNKIFKNYKPNQLILKYTKIRTIVDLYNE